MSKNKSFRGAPGGMGGLNLGALQKQAQEMQKKMLEAQEALANETVTVSVGGGAVTVAMTGHQKVSQVKITPDAAQDIEMLQDLVLAAMNEAVEKSQALASERMSAITGGLGNMGGLF